MSLYQLNLTKLKKKLPTCNNTLLALRDSMKELKTLLTKGKSLRLKKMNMKMRSSGSTAGSSDLIELGSILCSYFLFSPELY